MSVAFARRLLRTRVLPPAEVAALLLEALRVRRAFVRVLVERQPELTVLLEREFARLEVPTLRDPRARPELVELLPEEACERLGSVPVRLDPRTGTVEVATAYPHDAFLAGELSHLLGRPIRLVRAPIRELLTALDDPLVSRRRMFSDPPQERTPAFGTPVARLPVVVARALPSDAPIPLVRRLSMTPGAPSVARAQPAAAQSVAEAAFSNASRPTLPGTGALGTGGPAPTPGQPPAAGRAAPTAAFEGDGPRLGRREAKTASYRVGALLGGAVRASLSPAEGMSARRASVPPKTALLGSVPPPPAPAQERLVPPSAAERSDALLLERAIEGFAGAHTPDDVAHALATGLMLAAERAAVFSVRRDGHHGRVALGCGEVVVRELIVEGTSFEPFQRALRDGHWLGVVVDPPPELEPVLLPAEPFYVVSVRVAERVVLIALATGFDDVHEASRLADRLAAAAGDALERVLVERKSRPG